MRVGQERENVRADVARAARDEDRAGHVMLGLALLLYVLHAIVFILQGSALSETQNTHPALKLNSPLLIGPPRHDGQEARHL